MGDSIKKLADLFAKFPTVGTRTAARFVFYLINLPKQEVKELMVAMGELKNRIKFCHFCFNPHEGQENLCYICKDSSRNKQLLCIVEKENDLITIENTKKYRGLYFILGGTLTFRNNTGENLRLTELRERVKDPQKFDLPLLPDLLKNNFTEIIIATNPTPEGKATSLLVQRYLKELPEFPNFKITHLAQGLPVGGELEYADEETLESAFEGRK